jgi:hypothetical protein
MLMACHVRGRQNAADCDGYDNQYIVWGTNGANFSVYEECRPWAAGIAKQVTLMKKYWISAFEEEGEDTVSDGSEASEMEV